MKLYEVPRNSKVRVLEFNNPPPDALPISVGEVVLFKHVDGIYSYCLDSTGNIVHLAAWTEVEVLPKETDGT